MEHKARQPGVAVDCQLRDQVLRYFKDSTWAAWRDPLANNLGKSSSDADRFYGASLRVFLVFFFKKKNLCFWFCFVSGIGRLTNVLILVVARRVWIYMGISSRV